MVRVVGVEDVTSRSVGASETRNNYNIVKIKQMKVSKQKSKWDSSGQ